MASSNSYTLCLCADHPSVCRPCPTRIRAQCHRKRASVGPSYGQPKLKFIVILVITADVNAYCNAGGGAGGDDGEDENQDEDDDADADERAGDDYDCSYCCYA